MASMNYFLSHTPDSSLPNNKNCFSEKDKIHLIFIYLNFKLRYWYINITFTNFSNRSCICTSILEELFSLQQVEFLILEQKKGK